jgi:molybdate transport repressor ModE-like protein
MSTLDIDSMRALTVIAESGGITRAAKRLNLSQSAVSHKMKRLEQKLNRSLFARVEGKLGLSSDGEKLLDYARRLVKLHDEACASFHQSDLAGELRLGITEDISAPGMAQILSSFSTSFPNVALTSRVAHTPELVRWLRDGEIDMALIEVFESELLATDHRLGQQQVAWLLALPITRIVFTRPGRNRRCPPAIAVCAWCSNVRVSMAWSMRCAAASVSAWLTWGCSNSDSRAGVAATVGGFGSAVPSCRNRRRSSMWHAARQVFRPGRWISCWNQLKMNWLRVDE